MYGTTSTKIQNLQKKKKQSERNPQSIHTSHTRKYTESTHNPKTSNVSVFPRRCRSSLLVKRIINFVLVLVFRQQQIDLYVFVLCCHPQIEFFVCLFVIGFSFFFYSTLSSSFVFYFCSSSLLLHFFSFPYFSLVVLSFEFRFRAHCPFCSLMSFKFFYVFNDACLWFYVSFLYTFFSEIFEFSFHRSKPESFFVSSYSSRMYKFTVRSRRIKEMICHVIFGFTYFRLLVLIRFVQIRFWMRCTK